MERKTAANSISQSADIVSDNIDKLKQLFPSVFTEGNIDFEALKEILGDKVETNPEYYRFTWPGKAMAKEEARKPSRGTLRPAKDESVNWDNTENLYIEGDNLEVLKLLQKSYANKVKMIYIDPPYNTGKDFVYKDNYKDNLASYNEKFNRLDEHGNLKSSAAETNQEQGARYHSNWLNMIYPRLTLARNLLTEDGVILISIGDDELDNLKKISDEIFGMDNFILTFSRAMKSGGAKGKFYTPSIDYILVYSKFKSKVKNFRKPLTEEQIKRFYNKFDNDGTRKDELYGEERLYKASLDPRPNQRYYIKCPDESFVIPPGVNFPDKVKEGEKILPTSEDGVWKWIYPRYKNEYDMDNIIFKKTKTSALVDSLGNKSCWNIYNKLWLKEQQEKGAVPSNLITEFENRQSSKELKELNIPFDFAKPSSLIKYLIGLIGVENDEIVLDFFSGSASTAHALIELNIEDSGNRKFIQVQLPEPTDEKSEAFKAGYKTIPEIGKERIRRAGKKILEENPEQKDKLDIGFKVFKLDESNIKTWETDPEKLDENLFLEDVIKSDRTEEDVLYEILLKYGLDLTLPIQEKEIENQKLYAIGGGALLVYLGNNANTEIAQQIINWAMELDAINPQVVFKDNGFNNSQDKVNTLQVLKSNKITDVWSI